MKIKKILSIFLAASLMAGLCGCAGQNGTASSDTEKIVEEMLGKMSTEQKLAQMMIVALRSDAKNSNTAPELTDAYKEVLQKYDFGGIILFAGNIQDVEQTVNLIHDCQEAALSSTNGIPMFMAVDQEGGLVNRVSFGVTTPGNMALSATGDTSLTQASSEMLAEEISALGFNLDFAPVCDVNNNPNNPIIGIRSFSDDPQIAAENVRAYLSGLQKYNICSALKHFPGHGNVGEDSHTGLPLSELTVDELTECELIPFNEGIDAGTDMIMTAHIQYPKIEDDTYTSKKDGKEVYLPATLSRKVITDLLRKKMGYEGIVVTDAMDMDAIASHFDPIDAAAMAINADVDILLCPVNLYQDDAINTLPDIDVYMSALLERVESGDIPMEEIDNSVSRILKLKIEKGILNIESTDSVDAKITAAKEVVGSDEHREKEWEIAQKGMTLLKNEENVLPLDGNDGKKTLIMVPSEYRKPTAEYVTTRLDSEGLADASSIEVLLYSEMKKDDPALLEALERADRVIIVSQSSDKNEAVQKAIEEIHKKKGQAVFVSVQLPYDAATYDDVDAILCAYNPYGSSYDTEDRGPFNLNVAVALCDVFGESVPSGKLPVNIPVISFGEDGVTYTEDILFERGFGLDNWGK